jgi:hypothetical protein
MHLTLNLTVNLNTPPPHFRRRCSRRGMKPVRTIPTQQRGLRLQPEALRRKVA